MTYYDLRIGLASDSVAESPSIDAVLAAHGLRRVLAAVIAAWLRGAFRKSRPPDSRVEDLAPRMRVDIGLSPVEIRPWRYPL